MYKSVGIYQLTWCQKYDEVQCQSNRPQQVKCKNKTNVMPVVYKYKEQ